MVANHGGDGVRGRPDNRMMKRLAKHRHRRNKGMLAVITFLTLNVNGNAQLLRPADINALPSKPADARIAYGSDPLQFADLRLPPGKGPHPVAIIIHGGCWVSNYADLQNTAAQADALRDAGVATWNIEYRRNDNPGGGWPGTFQDVARAADHLRQISGQYKLDLKRVVATGHSAGGHLALWLAARRRLPKSSELHTSDPLVLTGVVVNGGPGDLEAARMHMSSPCGSDVIAGLMGGTEADQPNRYAQGSPVRLLPLGVPQIFLTGEHDQVVPANFADDYGAKARAAGDTVQHEVIGGVGHHEYNAPRSAAFAAVKRAVLSLLQANK